MSQIIISPITNNDVPVLEKELAYGERTKYRYRLTKQDEGLITFLIAWNGNLPIGHFLIDWVGAIDPKVATKVKCPNLKDLYVQPEFRRTGVAKLLISTAEDMAKGKGYQTVGLGVATDNLPANNLYQQLGYGDIGIEPLENDYEITTFDGSKQRIKNTVHYLVKNL